MGNGLQGFSIQADFLPVSNSEIERAVIKRYRSKLWAPFIRALTKYKLISDGDKIAVAISGGKDSLLLAKLFQELYKHGRRNFSLEFLAMDPGYHEHNRKMLEKHCKHMEIPVKILESDVFAVADKIGGQYPCYMCARMRRGFLYAKAQKLGCNKLALGHHFNDVIETILLNLLYGGNYKTMLPKLKAENFPGMELIRPLYYIREEHIVQFVRYAHLSPLDCACSVASKKMGSKRAEMKELVQNLKEKFSDVDLSIFRSAENVNVDRVLGYKLHGEKHSYIEDYYEEF